MGGFLLYNNLSWGAEYFTYMARPPYPEVSAERWRSRWLWRIENAPLVLREWLGHQSRDDYWKHGTLAENYASFECPVYPQADFFH